MRVGTKSILFGAHAFWLHPFMVAWAWFRLYGFRAVEWVYPDGATFEYRGGWLREYGTLRVSLWNPRLWLSFFLHDIGYWRAPNMDGKEGKRHPEVGARIMGRWFGQGWHDFNLLHSRHYADLVEREISPLCIADKYAQVFTPGWLYVPMVLATGEIEEYMDETGGSRNPRKWWREIQAWAEEWVHENSGGRVFATEG